MSNTRNNSTNSNNPIGRSYELHSSYGFLYLVAAQRYIGCCRVIDKTEVWNYPWSLLAITPSGTGPEDILLLGPSDWYGALRALAIFMPCLGYWMGWNVRVVIHASWVVRRLHLKGDDGVIS
jgi:hypothetical protein